MHLKANCNHGIVIDKHGNLLTAWSWYSTPECPHIFDVPDGGEIIELSKNEHEKISYRLHSHKYNHKDCCFFCAETGAILTEASSKKRNKQTI